MYPVGLLLSEIVTRLYHYICGIGRFWWVVYCMFCEDTSFKVYVCKWLLIVGLTYHSCRSAVRDKYW